MSVIQTDMSTVTSSPPVVAISTPTEAPIRFESKEEMLIHFADYQLGAMTEFDILFDKENVRQAWLTYMTPHQVAYYFWQIDFWRAFIDEGRHRPKDEPSNLDHAAARDIAVREAKYYIWLESLVKRPPNDPHQVVVDEKTWPPFVEKAYEINRDDGSADIIAPQAIVNRMRRTQYLYELWLCYRDGKSPATIKFR